MCFSLFRSYKTVSTVEHEIWRNLNLCSQTMALALVSRIIHLSATALTSPVYHLRQAALTHGAATWLRWMLSKQYPTSSLTTKLLKCALTPGTPGAYCLGSVSLLLFGLMHLFTSALPVTLSCDFNTMGCLSNPGVRIVHNLSTDLPNQARDKVHLFQSLSEKPVFSLFFQKNYDYIFFSLSLCQNFFLALTVFSITAFQTC